LESAIEQAGNQSAIQVIGVDMFIGLPDRSGREADALARVVAGPRRSSVFTAPIRPALEASTYAEALAISRKVTGRGLSAQAFGLRQKALEVDRFMHDVQIRVVEVHPEVSFAEMNGAPLPSSKKKRPGMEHRRRLLASNGLEFPQDLGELGHRANADDILDAAAIAWTAMRVYKNVARSLPSSPEVFSDGLPAAIWV